MSPSDLRPEPRIVLSCEHGGNRVPAAWAGLFRGHARKLRSHRGWDAGALSVARRLARGLGAPLIPATTTRLLVDLNRSPGHPAVFSEISRGLPESDRAALLERVHDRHWQRVRTALDEAEMPVLYLAVHSFTPVWQGTPRRFDLGLLYDPTRAPEKAFAKRLKAYLATTAPGLRVRRNAPYRGQSDGLTTAMRRERSAADYLGIELELNQRTFARPEAQAAVASTLVDAVRAILAEDRTHGILDR